MQNPTGNNENVKIAPTAALVVIGSEILSGRTQDVHTQWIGEKLTGHGIRLSEMRVVKDSRDKIIEAVNALRPRYDYVITTGGIGPTHDDVTSAALATAFNVNFGVNLEARALLEKHYGHENFSVARLKMAMMPAGVNLIPNPVSVAPGFIIDNVYVLAGIPRVMQSMFEHVLGLLERGDPILTNTIGCDLAEGAVSSGVGDVQSRYRSVEIGSYPYFRSGSVGVNIVLRSTDPEKLREATREVVTLVEVAGGFPNPIGMQAPLYDD
ncbi:MAG: competence/damage-inducible protein A [Alphaproteobacteria bacterium]|nr:competence/damage-inducible protein A [Alphaproteobacteria bacterium]